MTGEPVFPRNGLGLATIFQNLRDGVVLVRSKDLEVVVLNRAAIELLEVSAATAIGSNIKSLFADPAVAATARHCVEQRADALPSQPEAVVKTTVGGGQKPLRTLEIHFCRIDDMDRGGPLVLLVVRPETDIEVETAYRMGEAAAFEARRKGEEDVITATRKGEADVHIATRKGKADVAVATKKGEEDVELATRKGEADVHVATRRGQADVAVATRKGEEDVETAIRKGEADVDAATRRGHVEVATATTRAAHDVETATVKAEAGVGAAKRTRDLAQRRVDALEAVARKRALFFSAAAHEFSTPLTIIALQADLLRRAMQPAVAAQERALKIINSNVHRLVLLSQDLGDLARADAGRLVLKPVAVDLLTLVQGEIANFRALAQQQNLTLELVVVGQESVVEAEPARLRQVVGNFIGNAIKFTPPGGHVTLTVTTGEGRVTVEVRDTGPGMDEEGQAQLFRPFARVETPGMPKKPGTGLGLYLSKRIVEAHEGAVGCSSDGPGTGMMFWFTLPLAGWPGVVVPEGDAGAGRPVREPREERGSASPHRESQREAHHKPGGPAKEVGEGPGKTEDAAPAAPTASGDER